MALHGQVIGVEQDPHYCEIARARIQHIVIDPSGTNI